MPPSRAVGIDLGTTFVATARIDDVGRTAMVRNSGGDLLIPSVVFFEDQELLFGRAAKQAAMGEPRRVAEYFKRDLGQAAYSRAIQGELLPPELVVGCMLNHVWTDLSAGGEKCAAALSVPASFDQAQRESLRDATRIAGIDLLGTVNDTLAAALAFAESQGYLTPSGSDKPGARALVFDLGGGALDVAIVEIKPGRVRTMAVGGDAKLGGRDWDLLLADYLAGQFGKQFGEDPRHDMQSVGRLLQSAEEARQTLTARQQARVHIERGSNAADITVTRQTFEEITSELLERAKRIVEAVVTRAGMAWRDVGHLLLVGGASRMPSIAKMLESLTGLQPAPNVHPDEAVARGAALFAERLLAAREKRTAKVQVELTDLTARNLGVEWFDPQTGHSENVVIITRGTELPCSTLSNIATTVDGQTSITSQLLEGDSRKAEECTVVAQVVIRDLPVGLAKGWPIEVQYHYTPQGRLQVKARQQKSGQPLSTEMRRPNGLSDSQVADWQRLLTTGEGLQSILGLLAKHQQARAAEAPSVLSTGLPADGGHSGEGLDAGGFDLDSLEDLLVKGPKKQKASSRKIVMTLAGHVVFATLGLAIGYYILMRLDPSYNWLHLRLPGLSQEAPASGPASPDVR